MSKIKHGKIGRGGSIDACCLKLENVNVHLSGQDILNNVNFNLRCGEIVALIGPNGAGKSTLFRTILNQLPFEGGITFSRPGGKSERPMVGYVPQSPTFDRNDPVSVYDFFAAAISRYPVFLPVSKKLRARILECLSRVHAEELIDRKIGQLSGGELQRVLLAMALEPVPQILILDEPLSGVDVEGEKQLMDMLDEIRDKYDLSILYSTHDFNMIPQYADRVLLLKSTVLMVGSPDFVLSSEAFQNIFHLNLMRGGAAE